MLNVPIFERVFTFASIYDALSAIGVRLLSLVMVKHMVASELAGVVLRYLDLNWKASISPAYISHTVATPCMGQTPYSNSKKRQPYIQFTSSPGRYRSGWHVLWFSPNSVDDHESNPALRDVPMEFTYIRGTVDFESLLIAACAYEHAHDREAAQRHKIVRHHGKKMGDDDDRTPWMDDPESGCRPVGVPPEDLRPDRRRRAFDSLALDDAGRSVVDSVRGWIGDESWCRLRGVPWRLGHALWGPPGSGKTSVARAIALHHDLPVHVFDLATMTNRDLDAAWSATVKDTPCVLLVEDVDAVFAGRENLTCGELTFDAFLNMIDGVEQANGLWFVVTTNHPDQLDPALLRSGRVDYLVEFPGIMTQSQREQIAGRILADWPDIVSGVVEEGESDTPAEFQGRCVTLARERRYG